jgi:flagellar hook-associated protein 2
MDTVSSTGTTKTNTGSSIVSALGSGSGINSSALVDQLVEINKLPETNRLTKKETLLQAQISDFGLLRSAFTKLESAASLLGNADTFNAKSASIPTTTLLGITKLDAKASIGEFSLNVDQLAQAQSVTSANFASQTAPIGKGTLAIRLGSWTNVLPLASPPVADVFTVDGAKTGATITIDDSNNSLVGLRDAINSSNIGVKASIVGQTGAYKLLVTGPSGESNEIEITATEAPSALGLASFNFNNGAKNLTQQQEGRDAILRVNGLSVTRSTNHITDVVEGLEFDLFNKSTTETVNIGITADKTLAEKAIRDFVATYNTFLTDTKKLIGFDSEKNEYGSLRQDPMAKNLVQQVRSQLNANVVGVDGSFNSFASLGIRTNLGTDGTLTIDDSTSSTSFRSAMDKNFEAIRDLFVPKTSSSNAQISLTKYSDKSTAGTYAVSITNQPTKGGILGGAISGAAGNVIAVDASDPAKSYSFTAKVDGINTASIVLPAKNYTSGADLAADLQSLINLDANLTAAKATVAVVFNTTTGKLEFTSAAYGSSSKVDITAASGDMADIGVTIATGNSGNDVAGSVDGVAAFGFGNVLLPALGSKAEGLSMQVTPGATTGNITFSRGFSGSFKVLIDNFLKSNGLIKNRETNINKDVAKVKTDMTAVDRRSQAYRARLQAQFGAMESIVRSLKSTGTFLTGAFKALSAASSNNN